VQTKRCYFSIYETNILKLVNKNLQDYYKRMRFTKRLSKTIAFILYKLKLVSNMGIALQIINQGKLKL
jgi:hypothetical protein